MSDIGKVFLSSPAFVVESFNDKKFTGRSQKILRWAKRKTTSLLSKSRFISNPAASSSQLRPT